MLDRPKITLMFDRRKKASAVQRAAVEVVAYYRSKRTFVSTGVFLLKYQWKDNCVVEHPNANELNETIQAAFDEVKKRFAKMECEGVVNVEAIKSIPIVNNIGKKNFLDWMEEQIEEDNVANNTRKARRVVLSDLRDFGVIQTFEDLTPQNIYLWDRHIAKKHEKQVTIHSYHKRLKVYINRAIMLNLMKENPYDKMIRIPKGETDQIKFLTVEQRDAIMNLPLTSYFAKVRDMFIFSCFTGLAYADMCKITIDDIIETKGKLMIRDKRIKTKVPYNITLLGPAEDILRKYNYRLNLMSNQKANMYLKTVALLAGIRTNVTFHMARHTFATWALSEGIAIATVSKMLGHTNIKQTENYAKVLQKNVDDGFDILASKVPVKQYIAIPAELKAVN